MPVPGARWPCCWCLLLLLATRAHLAAGAGHAQSACIPGQELALWMRFATNATGHRNVSARLEQPLGAAEWQLSVEVWASGCGPGGAPRQTLALSLRGPPHAPPPSRSAPTSHSPTGAPAAPPPPVPSAAPRGYVTLPGLGHYRASPVALDWASARNVCLQEGARLLVPTSHEEVEKIINNLQLNATEATGDQWVWHGANDHAQKGKFVTDDGVPLENTGYAGIVGSDISGKCLAIYKITKLMIGALCSRRYNFVCKVPL